MIPLTIKDYLHQLAPCFCCKSQVNILLGSQSNYSPAYIKHNHLICEISKYYAKTNYFYIDLINSEFNTNYSNFLTPNPTLQIQCPNCHSYSRSQPLTTKHQYILPTQIQSQYLVVPPIKYHIYSTQENNSTIVYLKSKQLIQLPFIPSTNFKSKDQLINKINRLLVLK